MSRSDVRRGAANRSLVLPAPVAVGPAPRTDGASVTELAVQTTDLGKRYGQHWALRECSIEVPVGRVCGLVGANGAGKTTLLRILAGLSRPTSGTALVSGRAPADDTDFLAVIGYLGQDVPLYRRWTAAEHLALGQHLNPAWDAGISLDRLRRLGIPLDRRSDALSGGMRAQVALALAMGKRPQVLLLDEPFAALDPLARREFLGSLAGAMAEQELTVVLSSHLLPDLERICDHLIVLAEGRPVLCAGIDELLASHRQLRAAARRTAAIAGRHEIIQRTRTPREVTMTVRLRGPVLDPAWEVSEVGLEEIVLAYLAQGAPPPPEAIELVGQKPADAPGGVTR